MVVKVAGMCWVIRIGALSVTASSREISRVSACGPPVEAPISSTRGGIAENGRSVNWLSSGSAAGVRHLTVRWMLPPNRRSAGLTAGRANGGASGRLVLRRAPSAWIFSISSRWNAADVIMPPSAAGFGM